MELRPVSPHAYAALVPLIAEEPGMLDTRALLRAGRAEVVVYTDDLTQPTAVVVERQTATAHTVAFAGAIDARTLAAYVRALERPVTLYAPATLAARLPGVRADLVACPQTTFMPPATGGTAFPAMPPGGMRRLRAADARALTAVPEAIWGTYDTAAMALREGIVYARYLRAEIVSLACATAHTERYAGIAAFTIERARRNGFARDCAARLIGALGAEWGVTPLLSAAADDDAARGLAHALGLTEEHAWTAYALV